MAIHTEAVSETLIEIGRKLCSDPRLDTFRIVGGTAIALHLGHRKSVDIDFFSDKKVNKTEALAILKKMFPMAEFYVTEHNISTEVSNVKIELFDDWDTSFREAPFAEGGLRLATLQDLAALKLDAIVGRREKKDYIDLYVIFQKLGAIEVLNQFKSYNSQVSEKSLLFALSEVVTARENKSVMPDMLIDLSWPTIENSMINAAREFLSSRS